jgi:hypothetical protein
LHASASGKQRQDENEPIQQLFHGLFFRNKQWPQIANGYSVRCCLSAPKPNPVKCVTLCNDLPCQPAE